MILSLLHQNTFIPTSTDIREMRVIKMLHTIQHKIGNYKNQLIANGEDSLAHIFNDVTSSFYL